MNRLQASSLYFLNLKAEPLWWQYHHSKSGTGNNFIVINDRKTLVATNKGAGINIVDTKSLKSVGTINVTVPPFNDAAFSPSSVELAIVGRAQSVDIADVESKKIISRHTDHSAEINSVQFYDQNTLVTSSYDKTIKMWDTRQTKPTMTFTGHNSFVYSAHAKDNQIISCSFDETARVWDMRNYSDAVRVIKNKSTVTCARFVNNYAIISDWSGNLSKVMGEHLTPIVCGNESITKFATNESATQAIFSTTSGLYLVALSGLLIYCLHPKKYSKGVFARQEIFTICDDNSIHVFRPT